MTRWLIKMKICRRRVSVDFRDFLQPSVLTMSKGTTRSHDTGYCLSLLRAATARLPFLNIGMRAILCWKLNRIIITQRMLWRPSLVAGNTMYSASQTTWVGVVMGMKTDNVFRILLAITSNEDACRTLGLVEKVAVDGEEGAAHDAASRRGHSGHLWITNINGLTINYPTGINLVGGGKTSPANVWVMPSFIEPKTLYTSLSVELLKKKQKLVVLSHCCDWLKCTSEAHYSCTAQAKAFEKLSSDATFHNQHQEWNSGFDVLFE